MSLLKTKQGGQTLIEVLIAIVIVVLVLMSVLVAVIFAVRSTQYSKHKSQAAFLAQEAIEWVRDQRREMEWGLFWGKGNDAGGATYCLQELNFSDQTPCNNEGDLIDDLYFRDLVLTSDVGGDQVTAAVEVTWFEGNKQFGSPVDTAFYQWDLQN